MSILEPVRHELELPLSAAEAFTLFTQDIARWWPFKGHSCSGGEAQQVLFEPRVGGAVVEVAKSGQRHPWGTLTTWDPPHRLVMTWHPAQPADRATQLEVRFEDIGGGSRLLLVHDGWQVRGDDAPQVRESYREGWEIVLACLATLAKENR